MRYFLFFSMVLLGGEVWAKAAEKEADLYRVPRSTLEAIERKLNAESVPEKRVQLVLRWVKDKEDYEQALMERKVELSNKPSGDNGKTVDSSSVQELGSFKGYKQAIVDRIEREISQLKAKSTVNLDPLYHVLGFRLLELQKYAEAIRAFETLTVRSAEDWMGLGDAFFSSNQTRKALDAFEHGALDAKFKTTAAYKRAWCFLQLSDFPQALTEFDLVLQDNPFNTIKLKEEAYRDRLRPYVETFVKADFDLDEVTKLRTLASRVYPQDLNRAKELLATGLRSLIVAFNAKAQVGRAEAVFSFLTKEIPDPTSVLIMAAPLWIKVYRGQLNYQAVERIVLALPSKKIENIDSAALQAELYNSVVFYDTLFKEDGAQTTRRLLFLLNQKFFQLFPDDQNADSLRVTYSKLLLEDGDPAECIQILSRRKGDEKDIEELALSLDAKCQLKQLDQLYQKDHDDFFYSRLKQNLLEKKIYERSDLGLSSEAAFESMARMLIGAVNKNPKLPLLRDMVYQLILNYRYARDTKLFTDLQILLAELNFQDLLESKESPDDRADKFFGIFSSTPTGCEVSKKALLNSIMIGRELRVLDRCEIFLKQYPDEFKTGKDVFERCVHLSEHHLTLAREYLFWIQSEALLNPSQQLKIGLIELALGMPKGRRRILDLKTESAKTAIQLWDGVSDKQREAPNPKFEKLFESFQTFLKGLRPISFAKIKATVPGHIRDFEYIDSQAVTLYRSKPTPLVMAKTLELRAELAVRMRDWIKVLPEPAGLKPEELKEYRTKAGEVLKGWEDGAAKRIQECGEVAHTLTMDYRVSNVAVCPDLIPESVYDRYLEKWNLTKQKDSLDSVSTKEDVVEKGESLGFLLEAGKSSKDPLQARYLLIRALDMSTRDSERARAYLALAKLTNKDVYWESAASLDGNLLEPIQWWRQKATGNLFFEKLYDKMISKVK
jgi:tetratricopeptide (TPR) repeat protein